MKQLAYGLIILVFWLGADMARSADDGVDVRSCESAFTESGKWRHPDRDAVETALRAASRRDAVTALLGETLDGYPYGPFSRDALVETLKGFIRCEDARMAAAPPLDFCMSLSGCAVEGDVRERLRPMEIARVCGIDPDQVAAGADRIETAFAESLTGPDDGRYPETVRSMMNDPGKIGSNGPEVLGSLVRRVEAVAGPESLDGTVCLALVVYPIDLYAATTPTD